MLLRISAILSIILLMLLQYGRITEFLYCEWQAKVVLQLPDCNCTQLLDGVFDESDDHTATEISSSKEKLSDYTVVQSHSVAQLPQLIIISFDQFCKSAVTAGFVSRIKRPPIA